MILWIDDIRTPHCDGKNHLVCKSVDRAKHLIEKLENIHWTYTIRAIRCKNHGCDDLYDEYMRRAEELKLEYIDIDHDAGDYAQYGGDYIRLLDWLEETGRNYPIRIHSMNPVGVANMRAIIQRNGWSEIR